MSEILFRGKRLDTEEWIEGTNILMGENGWCYICETGATVHVRYNNSTVNPQLLEAESFRVDIETIGQFSGMLDKNNRKIFEGDIVLNENGIRYECTFTSKYARFAFRRSGVAFGWFNPKSCEVIGNVYDNPTLLEGE